jgi:pimeloyl-ACP methyl ester carboxylesterase
MTCSRPQWRIWDIPPGTDSSAPRAVIPDCGHLPHLEHPSQFLAELLPFLAS